MSRILAMVAIMATLTYAATPLVASADDKLDYTVDGGHFYTQTNGTTSSPNAGGFSITDANGIPFWTFFNQQGGPAILGYPVSSRFIWDGYTCQATQREIMQWNPTTGHVQLANLYDYLSGVGRDDWLLQKRLAPKVVEPTAELTPKPLPLTFAELAHSRYSWLYQDPSIFQHYFNTPDYVSIYGLPTSPVVDLGQYYAVRFQRAVMYHWKSTVPWADPKGVSVGLGGDLFKQLGLIPVAAIQPLPNLVSPNAAVSSPPATHSYSTMQASTPRPAPAASAQRQSNSSAGVTGTATWYGSYFQGEPMYNGDAYNMYDPTTTAANAFSIGTWLRVTRLSTGRSILVQVTDRGAFRYPDIVDLSYAAFARLADPSTGVISVRVEPAY